MTEERPFYIYCHTAPNCKRYIGQTCQQPNVRWARGHGYREQGHFKNAIDKYGWENFEHQILCVVHSKKMADLFEQHYIAKFDTFNREHGYNLTKGGGGAVGRTMPEETKRRMSEQSKGRVIGEQQRRQISATLKEGYQSGRIAIPEHSPELLERMSRERTGEGNPMYGRHHSEDARRRIKEFHTGRKRPPETGRRISEARYKSDKIKRCPVDQFDLDGNYIASFPSMAEAERSTGIFATNISACCKGKAKQTKGYVFKYQQAA